MSDYAVNLLKAIESGDQDVMNTAFTDALNAKVVDAIDAKKIEVARGIYGGQEDNTESDDIVTDSDDEVELETTETSEENGTEEV
jgi:hypothetical protein